jgi:hypothetical protein
MPALRQQRMERFLQLMRPAQGAAILDVGGLPALNGVPGFWQGYVDAFEITLLNLPGSFDRYSKAELAPYRLIEADACKCVTLSKRYDVVFSNSVVEHVGSSRRQERFASFIRSAAESFWVQTPSPFFPVEAHCDVPFWWSIPIQLRKKWIMSWRRSGEHFLANQMASTRPIGEKQLRQLLPNCTILTEHFLGFPKSLIAYGR